MPELKTVITIIEIIIGVAAAIVIGDYLGYKFGHMKIASYALFGFLGIVILFAIYAAIYFVLN
jgi:hypothetical protein